MAIAAAPAKISTVASFPEHFFLENLAVRADGSILVTVLNHKQFWYVPAPDDGRPVTPALVHTFDFPATGIVETEPDVFYVSTAGQATLQRFDLRGWEAGAPVRGYVARRYVASRSVIDHCVSCAHAFSATVWTATFFESLFLHV